MTLLKPTRRDIVRAATEETRKSIWRDSEEKGKESVRVANEAAKLRSEAAERVASRQMKKLEPLAKALNAVAKKAGYGNPFSIVSYDGNAVSSGTAGSNVVVQIDYNHTLKIKTKAKYPEDTDKITKLQEESHRLSREANDLRHLANNLDDNDVISGSINAALNGDAADALEVLVQNIKEVTLDQADLKFAHRRR